MLPGQPGASGSGRFTTRQLLLAGLVGALLLVLALAWFLTDRNDTAPSARSTQETTGPSSSASPTGSGRASGGATGTKAPASSTRAPAKGSSSAPAAKASASPLLAPNATFKNTCRYVLGDSSSDPKTGLRFVAESVVENTGNTGIEVEVQAIWEQGEAESVTEIKRARIDWREERTVSFSVPATKQQIDLIRSHTGPEPNCKVNASIILTYGTLH